MQIDHLIIHDTVDTPDGVGKVIACDTRKVAPGVYDFSNPKAKVFFEPTKLYPYGIERTYLVADIEHHQEPTT